MSTRDAMRRLIPPGSYVLFLFFLVGIWLTISPFAMTTQPSGSHWIASTVNNVTIGAIMMAPIVTLLTVEAIQCDPDGWVVMANGEIVNQMPTRKNRNNT